MAEHRIGVISDTHSLIRPQALAALQSCELIVHAGDVGTRDVLEALERIAPVVAVRGNVDRGELARSLRRTQVVVAGQARLYVIHDLAELDVDPAEAGYDAVSSGHTHRPSIEHRNGVLFLNPGSAGARRFRLPVSLAVLRVQSSALEAQLIELAV